MSTSSPTAAPPRTSSPTVDEDVSIISPFYAFQNHEWGWDENEAGIASYFLIFLTLLSLAFVFTNKLEKMKHSLSHVPHNTMSFLTKVKYFIGNFLPEAGLVIIIGALAGGIIEFIEYSSSTSQENSVSSALVTFDSSTFFLLLLPPIIFNSGYHLNRDLFFPLLLPISMFAIIGTTISCATIALSLHFAVINNLTGNFKPDLSELLAFGGLISATDPVSTLAVFSSKKCDPTLFYIVFGESVLNDAVGLVLYDTLSKFVGYTHDGNTIMIALLDFVIIFAGSTVLGLFCGASFAYLLKVCDMGDTPHIQICLYIIITYLPVFIAETLGMSGIVTVMFTAIVAKCYASRNITVDNSDYADNLFRLFSHLAETAIFLQLGLSIFAIDSESTYNWKFMIWSLLACLIGRAIHVYPISAIVNGSLSSKKRDVPLAAQAVNAGLPLSPLIKSDADADMIIPRNTQHMVFFSGLRGAVAFACVTTFPDKNGNKNAFILATMVIVCVTVFLLGGTTSLVLDKLGIESGVDEDDYMRKQNRKAEAAALQNVGIQKNGVITWFKGLDKRFISPALVRDYKVDKDFKDIVSNGTDETFDEDESGSIELQSRGQRPPSSSSASASNSLATVNVRSASLGTASGDSDRKARSESNASKHHTPASSVFDYGQ